MNRCSFCCKNYIDLPFYIHCFDCIRRNGGFPPREYQKKNIIAILKAFRNHIVVLYRLSTGGGKTRVASEVSWIVRNRNPENDVLFLSHRNFLNLQIQGALQEKGIESQIIKGKAIPVSSVCISTMATMYNRLTKHDLLDALPKPKLVIIDEAHRVKSPTNLALLNYFKEHGAKILLLTATPIRLDKSPLSEVATCIIDGPPTEKLIEMGYLMKPKVFAKFSPDLSNVRKQMGDYVVSDLENVFNTVSSHKQVLEEYKKHLDGKRCMFFCVNVNHCNSLGEFLAKNGVPTGVITGSTKLEKRQQIFRDFREGKILALVNCEVGTDGFDEPRMEGVALVRSTESLGMYLQMVGRGMRIYPGKTSILLDFSGNVSRFGRPERNWDFVKMFWEGQPKRIQNDVDFKNCEFCGYLAPRNERICPECGNGFVERRRTALEIAIEILDLPLREIVEECSESENDTFRRILRVIQKSRKYKNGWINHVVDCPGESEYFREFFRELLRVEVSRGLPLNPDSKHDIKEARKLDTRRVWRKPCI